LAKKTGEERGKRGEQILLKVWGTHQTGHENVNTKERKGKEMTNRLGQWGGGKRRKCRPGDVKGIETEASCKLKQVGERPTVKKKNLDVQRDLKWGDPFDKGKKKFIRFGFPALERINMCWKGQGEVTVPKKNRRKKKECLQGSAT